MHACCRKVKADISGTTINAKRRTLLNISPFSSGIKSCLFFDLFLLAYLRSKVLRHNIK